MLVARRSQALLLHLKYDSIRYNLMSISFDPATRSFGKPVLEVDAVSENKSISVPRVSPDGRFVLYTKGDYGQFHIWHKSSDLWVKDLQTDSCYALQEANSPDVDSFHSWSSNGRWFVFSSRRMPTTRAPSSPTSMSEARRTSRLSCRRKTPCGTSFCSRATTFRS